MPEGLFSWDHWVDTWKGGLHFALALFAIVIGGMMLVRRKGTTSHRIFGTMYVVSMAIINVSALTMYDINGRMTLFHWFAILSLGTLTPGYLAILIYKWRRTGLWLELHRQFLTWSYFGLVAAGVWQVGIQFLLVYFGNDAYGTIITALNIATFAAAFGLFFIMRPRRAMA